MKKKFSGDDFRRFFLSSPRSTLPHLLVIVVSTIMSSPYKLHSTTVIDIY